MKETSCPYASSCHFFAIENATGNTEVLKEHYCYGEHRNCAIYRRRKSYKPVSMTLWPDGSMKAG